MPGKRFPIQGAMAESLGCPASVPWSLVEPHEAQAMRNHSGQTLACLAERGGLGPSELVAVLADQAWRSMPLGEAVAAIKKAIADHGVETAGEARDSVTDPIELLANIIDQDVAGTVSQARARFALTAIASRLDQATHDRMTAAVLRPTDIPYLHTRESYEAAGGGNGAPRNTGPSRDEQVQRLRHVLCWAVMEQHQGAYHDVGQWLRLSLWAMDQGKRVPLPPIAFGNYDMARDPDGAVIAWSLEHDWEEPLAITAEHEPQGAEEALRFLADQPCREEAEGAGPGFPCSETGTCVTEWCPFCYARAHLPTDGPPQGGDDEWQGGGTYRVPLARPQGAEPELYRCYACLEPSAPEPGTYCPRCEALRKTTLACTNCGDYPARSALIPADAKAGDQCPCCYVADIDCDGVLVDTASHGDTT